MTSKEVFEKFNIKGSTLGNLCRRNDIKFTKLSCKNKGYDYDEQSIINYIESKKKITGLTFKELVKKYGIDRDTIRRLRRNGQVKYVIVNNKLNFYDENSIIEYLEKKAKEPIVDKKPFNMKEYSKEYGKKHRDRYRLYERERYARDRERINAVKKAHRERTREKQSEYRKRAQSKRKDKTNTYSRERSKKDIEFKLRRNISCRIRAAIRNGWKAGSAIELLGCSISEFKVYIEKQFTPEMNWENHTKYFHFDHNLPCSAFDLTKELAQRKCFHYTNLRPLEWNENLRKLDKIPLDLLLSLDEETISVMKEKWQKLYYEHKSKKQLA